MFEVAYCVMLYTTVLSLEFSPIVLERFNLQKPLKIVRAALIPLVILGVILSTLHQSSLGTVYLIMPEKLHPLLVHAASSRLLLRLGDRRWTGDDHLRIVDEFEVLRAATGVADSSGVGTSAGRGALRLRDSAL